MSELLQKLETLGFDAPSALDRFMQNEALLMRMLKKYPEQESADEISKAFQEKNYDVACRIAHTLKGVCGNLSFIPLYDIYTQIVDNLRKQNLAPLGNLITEAQTKDEHFRKIILEN